MAEQSSWNTGLDDATVALTLESLDGVGRVTVRRLLESFSDVGKIGRLPREQVLNRLKGVAGAAGLIDRLADDDVMREVAADAAKRVGAWSSRQIAIKSFRDPSGWPDSLDRLPNPHRPNILFAYGVAARLDTPHAAIIARGELTPEPFERAQALIVMLGTAGVATSLGAATGFDVVGMKLSEESGQPPILVASTGLARIPQSVRPHASKAVKAGGVMVSSLPMDHGPFEHDRREGSLVQGALATAVVFVDPEPDSFDWTALEWALEVNKPVFAIGGKDLPDRVHVITDRIDMEWVMAAVEHVG